MATPGIEQPALPEYLTWEELEALPAEIAEQIELWRGRVVWMRRGPGEHQVFTGRMWAALERSARADMSAHRERYWRANFETNIFFGPSGKSDFMTPDFLVHRCLGAPYQDVRSPDVLLVGEVLSPSNTKADIEAKKFRYADAGIPWYWEVQLTQGSSAIEFVRAYTLGTEASIPRGVRLLHPANYLAVGEWFRTAGSEVSIDHPFPIRIPWADLAF